MNNNRIKLTFTVFLMVCFFGIASTAIGQKKIQPRHIILNKGDTTKVLSFPDRIDTSQMVSVRQGSASGVAGNKIQIDGYTENQNLHSLRMDASPIEKIVESLPLSSVESHRSERMANQNNNMISDATIRNLSDMVDNNMDGVPDGWASNASNALKLIVLADGSRQLTISCQAEPVYLIKYFEANAGTEYEVFLTYSGQETNLSIEEFSANNQHIVDGIHHALLKEGIGRQFAMKFRTGGETKRIFIKIEVSTIGNIVLNRLILQPVLTMRRSEQ